MLRGSGLASKAQRKQSKAGGGVLGIFGKPRGGSMRSETETAVGVAPSEGVRFVNISYAYPMALSRILYRNVSFHLPFAQATIVMAYIVMAYIVMAYIAMPIQ